VEARPFRVGYLHPISLIYICSKSNRCSKLQIFFSHLTFRRRSPRLASPPISLTSAQNSITSSKLSLTSLRLCLHAGPHANASLGSAKACSSWLTYTIWLWITAALCPLNLVERPSSEFCRSLLLPRTFSHLQLTYARQRRYTPFFTTRSPIRI
jgi:hypothetical protein